VDYSSYPPWFTREDIFLLEISKQAVKDGLSPQVAQNVRTFVKELLKDSEGEEG
jgi:hypothetical protein